MEPDPRSVLIDGAAAMGVPLHPDRAGLMLGYLQLLGQWNRAYNLTAITDPGRQITHHLLDSLSVFDWLQGERIADVGSGAGLPGIPLAIADPQRHFTLVESRAKKTRFLGHVVRSLGLENIEVCHTRIEDYRPHTGFDTVVARALTSLSGLTDLAAGLLAPNGILLAMKGRDPAAEAGELATQWGIRGIYPIDVPGLQAERHLVVIGKN